MSTIYWIALGIVLFSLFVLGVAAMLGMKRMKQTMSNIQQLQVEGDTKITYYTSELELVSQKTQGLSNRANTFVAEIQSKADVFEQLSDSSSELSETLSLLNNNKNRLITDVVKTSGKEAKRKAPEFLQLMKKTFKKTIHKQKERYSESF